jgi:hypothetical protein
MDNPEEALQYGIEQMPSLVYFEDTIPHLFEGNLANENEVLGWLLHQMKTEEIEQVTDEMLEMLILEHQYVAALFCKLNLHHVLTAGYIFSLSLYRGTFYLCVPGNFSFCMYLDTFSVCLYQVRYIKCTVRGTYF